jgi:hypothetical protein
MFWIIALIALALSLYAIEAILKWVDYRRDSARLSALLATFRCSSCHRRTATLYSVRGFECCADCVEFWDHAEDQVSDHYGGNEGKPYPYVYTI